MNELLISLKRGLKNQKSDYFLLPNSDEFFSEYLPEKQKYVQFLTGFTGSAATVIFGVEKSYFFTDGRYILQAQNQLDSAEFEIFNIAEKPLVTWISENIAGEKKLTLDAKLLSVNFVMALQKICSVAFKDVAELFLADQTTGDSTIFCLDKKITGADFKTKRALILQGLEADAQIITKPENLCWLLNIRAADVEFTPLLLAYAILFKNGNVELFAERSRLQKPENNDLKSVKFSAPQDFATRILELKKVQLDVSTTNYWLYDLLQKNGCAIINRTDPIDIAKACKNPLEISGAIKAHEADGIALTEFLFWLKNCGDVDEIYAAQKLLDFKKQNPDFFCESFAAISGFGPNGAVIHYRATTETNRAFSPTSKTAGSLYLLDSGAQYLGADFCATTDVTRTVAIGIPSAEMQRNFTLVLQGHIALAGVKFPRGTSGAQLDVLARQYLWQNGLDYDHGTGHGVGSFLSVHEGPCGISKRAHQELLPGMILSNEPGFYKAKEYGIRIENLLLVEAAEEQKFLQFKTLTLAPIDPDLIDFTILTASEKKWLCDYHQQILKIFADKVSSEVKNWLQVVVTTYNANLG